MPSASAEYEIRPLTADECEILPQLEADAAAAFANAGYPAIYDLPANTAQCYAGIFASGHIIAADHETHGLVGFAALQDKDSTAYIYEIDVRLSHAGKGLGKALIDAAINWAKAQGYTAITLTTFADIPFNAPFYQKCGFRPFEPDAAMPDLAATLANERAGALGRLGHRIAMIYRL